MLVEIELQTEVQSCNHLSMEALGDDDGSAFMLAEIELQTEDAKRQPSGVRKI